MKVLIIGGDGYLGWPTAMAFSARGDEVMLVDNFAKRKWELEEGITPLGGVPTLQERIKKWVAQLREEMTRVPKIEIEEIRAEA